MAHSELELNEAMQVQVSPVVSAAKALVVKTDAQSIEAQEILKTIKAKRRWVEEFFAASKSAAYKAHQLIKSNENALDQPLAEAERIVKEKTNIFIADQEHKRQEEARIAEAKRQEAERKERERIEEQARKAREAGKTEKADALEEKAAAVVVQPTFVSQAPATKISGVSVSKVWKGECVDLLALCKAIASGAMPVSMVDPNTAAINAHAKVWKVAGIQHGIEIKEVSQMAVR